MVSGNTASGGAGGNGGGVAQAAWADLPWSIPAGSSLLSASQPAKGASEGPGGAGGKGGIGAAGGIFDSTGTVIIKPSMTSGNTQHKGAHGVAGLFGDHGLDGLGYAPYVY